jgi:hypothetical protein
MRISWFIALGFLSLLLTGAGCSASATTGTASGGVTITGLPSSCAADSTVTCGDSADGYSCTSTDSPDANDATLECSIGVVDGANTDYCCLPSTFSWGASSCGQDDSVTCPTPGSFGFSCAGSDTPDQTDPTLTCTAGTADPTQFCCISGIAGDTGGSSGGGTIVITTGCTVDASVAGCADPSTGYSCTGTDPPDQADPTLSCSIGVADATDATLLDYCCLTGITFVAGTCAQDDSITCPTPGSFGFSCDGTDTPEQTDPSLTCTAGSDPTQFCCAN